jgi:hypothetical protein
MKTWTEYDLVVSNNADWDEVIPIGLPGDSFSLTGATFVMDVRASANAPDSFATYTSPQLILTEEPPGSRSATLHVDNSDIENKLPPGDFVYDIVVTLGSKTFVGARGTIASYQGVTR